MDYSFFDSLIDGIFIIDEGKAVTYCNDAAATLVGSSVKRIIKGRPAIYDLFEVSESSYLVSPEGQLGFDSPAPVQEMNFRSLKGGESFKVQLSIQPSASHSGEKFWVVMVHDVTLEERLHTKYQGELEQKEGMIKELKAARSQLEEYSKNLEKMVDERTQQVKKANGMLKAIMNSLGQGFLVFDKEGTCGDIFTEACKDILQTNPMGQSISDVLKVKESEREQFEKWRVATFSEALPFDSMKELAPAIFDHSEDRHVTLDYFPIFEDVNGSLDTIVVVATDKTSEYQANLALEREKQFVRMVTKLIKNKNQYSDFVRSSRESMTSIYAWVEAKGTDIDPDYLFRELHTLEGEAGAFHAGRIRQSSRDFQSRLEPIRRGEEALTSSAVQDLLGKASQLLRSHDQFMHENQEIFQLVSLSDERDVEISVKDLVQFADCMKSAGIDESLVESFRREFLYEDLSSLLNHYNDVVQQVASQSSKKVGPIQFDESNVKILPEAYSTLVSSMVHLFRNAVDHGIETPEVRLERGKSEVGTIRVQSEFEVIESVSWLKLTVSDDGNGIDVDRIRRKIAEDQGADTATSMSRESIMMSIFEAGFTSRDEVGEFSGRGVGMDAVKNAVESMGGYISVTSTLGKETSITIAIPDRSVQTADTLVA